MLCTCCLFKPATLLSFQNLLYRYFKKGSHSQWSVLEPKGTLGTVIMSDNAPAKVVSVWP